MAFRTEEEILSDYQQSVSLTDATADTSKGPLFSLVGRPLAQVISPTEEAVDNLNKTYSIEFVNSADDAEAEAFLTNWSEDAGLGAPSTVRVYFLAFTKPRVDQIIDIPVGSLIGNNDQSLQYITVESGQIRGDIADSFFNPQRRAYEVSVLVQAVANGPQYDLPQGRINTKISPLVGIDALENRSDATGGVAAETLPQQISRVQQKFEGLAVNTVAGNITRIQRYNPSVVLDVKPVVSTNRKLFRRVSYQPATDYYILGTLPRIINESYISQVGGETLIPLTNVPVMSVNSVTLNNVPISNWSLVKDTSFETGYSAVAQDKLLLGAALLAGDVLIISVSYNALIQEIQTNLFSEATLFETSELARESRKIPVRVEIAGRALPSYDPTKVTTNIQEIIQAFFEPGVWQGEFVPTTLLEKLRLEVPGLSSPQLRVFQRTTLSSSDVETIIIEDNELAEYDPAYIVVTVRTT